jgi:hypothetical protein
MRLNIIEMFGPRQAQGSQRRIDGGAQSLPNQELRKMKKKFSTLYRY